MVAVNEAGQVMILEGYKHGLGRSAWQTPGGYIEEGEEPLETAKRELLEETGYASDDWRHLGSFVVDANRRVNVGHFFLARAVRQVASPASDDLEESSIRWVAQTEVRVALVDGRVGVISHGVNIALALLVLSERPDGSYEGR